jgi:small-conductance mechanosensitive channel
MIDILSRLEGILPAAPSVVALMVTILLLIAGRRLLDRQPTGGGSRRFEMQLVLVAGGLAGLVAIIMLLPIPDTSRSQLLNLLGIVFSAAVALSSATLLGNLMAGFVLRTVRNFRIGDFIRVEDHFGRVTERELFHIEIQTEDRDLTTLPNLYLAGRPVTVIHSDGTILATRVSLGYDVPRLKIEEALLGAAAQAGLQGSFVQVLELGDNSVTYRVAGLYENVKRILSKRSELRARVMDALHEAGIEIVSPGFRNNRTIAENHRFIPPVENKRQPASAAARAPETLVFDKAEHAEYVEKLTERTRVLADHIKELHKEISAAETDEARADLQADLDRAERQNEHLKHYLETERENNDG